MNTPRKKIAATRDRQRRLQGEIDADDGKARSKAAKATKAQ
jgi:hypothetical protein